MTDVALLLRYRATYARVLDANRKFVEAAMRYYDLSNTSFADVSHINIPKYFIVSEKMVKSLIHC